VIRLILRLVMVPIGIGFAGLAAVAVGLVGAVSSGYGASLAGVVEATGLSIAVAALTGVDPSDIASFVALLWLLALGVVFVPVAIVAIAGELFGIASWFTYAFGMAALFALVPVVFPGEPGPHGWPERALLGFCAMGLAAGTVYWALAGRGAGRARRTSELPPRSDLPPRDETGRLRDTPEPRERPARP